MKMMHELYVAMSEGDMPTVRTALDPAVEWRQAEGNPYQRAGEAWRGPDAIEQNLVTRLATEWDGFTMQVCKFHDAGSVVVVEARYTGTYKQTGKKLDAQACHIWKIRDGHITSFQEYVDTAQLQDVEGAR